MNSTSPGGRGHQDQELRKLLATADGEGEDEEDEESSQAIGSPKNGKRFFISDE